MKLQSICSVLLLSAGCSYDFIGGTGTDTGTGTEDTNPSTDTQTVDSETNVASFDDGPIADDPFGDSSKFGNVVKYDNRLYLGPNAAVTSAIKADGNGSNPEVVTFSIVKDTVAEGGGSHLNPSAGPFTTFLGENAPDLENAPGHFAAGAIDGVEHLFYMGTKTAESLDYFYYTTDVDNVLDWKYFDMSGSTGGGTKSVLSEIVFRDRLYLGMTESGGKNPKAPRLVVALDLTQQDGISNTAEQACSLVLHSNCSLDGELMPYIGMSNTSPAPAKPNPATLVGIDSMAVYDKSLYLANNGGVIRSAIPNPLNYLNHAAHWDRTPALNFEAEQPSHRTDTIRLTRGSDLTRRELGYPQMAVYRNNLYVIRNACAVAAQNATYPSLSCSVDQMKPQLWQFDGVSWTAMVQSSGITNFGNPNNKYITMVVRNGGTDTVGGVLYVGFDNDVDGIAVYKTNEDAPSTIGDWSGWKDEMCSASCTPIANYGLGTAGAGLLTKILQGISIEFEGEDYLYVAVGDSQNIPLRVYRARD
jgi:hypothetical protein